MKDHQIEIGTKVKVKNIIRKGQIGTVESYDYVNGLMSYRYKVSFSDNSGSGYYKATDLKEI